VPELNKKIKHDISVIVDRIIINNELGNRLAESVETALNLSDGLLFVEYENETLPKKFRKIEKIIFSSKFACPESGFTIEEIEPRLFSFNSPYGACEECEGIGANLNVNPNLVVPNNKKSLAAGAIEPWSKSTSLYYAQTLASLAKHYKFSLDEPWKKLPEKIKNILLYGSHDDEIKFNYDDGYEKYSTNNRPSDKLSAVSTLSANLFPNSLFIIILSTITEMSCLIFLFNSGTSSIL